MIGNPVAHSRSPQLHNAAMEAAGLDSVYLPFLVDDLALFLKTYSSPEYGGFSVTIPHKVCSVLAGVVLAAVLLAAVLLVVYNMYNWRMPLLPIPLNIRVHCPPPAADPVSYPPSPCSSLSLHRVLCTADPPHLFLQPPFSYFPYLVPSVAALLTNTQTTLLSPSPEYVPPLRLLPQLANTLQPLPFLTLLPISPSPLPSLTPDF